MTMQPDKRIQLTLNVPPDLKRRLVQASARRKVSLDEYVLGTLEAQLRADMAAADVEGLTALSARTDPVLAELWNNDLDAEYDRL